MPSKNTELVQLDTKLLNALYEHDLYDYARALFNERYREMKRTPFERYWKLEPGTELKTLLK